MNLDDPVLRLAISELSPDDYSQACISLAGLERYLNELAAMVPHQPFADAVLKAAALVLHSLRRRIPKAREWCDGVGEELRAHNECLRPDPPPYPIEENEEEETNG